ncbi:MAG TPA: hypothetical protein VJ692_05170 [Nitrospiraceae bacterium]|nr:hypothetical protein [Nitrospiraceae bacterium]
MSGFALLGREADLAGADLGISLDDGSLGGLKPAIGGRDHCQEAELVTDDVDQRRLPWRLFIPIVSDDTDLDLNTGELWSNPVTVTWWVSPSSIDRQIQGWRLRMYPM